MNRRGVFRVWLVSYLLVLVIPLTVSVLVYSTSIAITSEDARKIDALSLSQTRIAADEIFSSVYATGRRILAHEAVLSLVFAEWPLSTYKLEKIGALQKNLMEYTAQNDCFRKIYVYFVHAGFAATTEGLCEGGFFARDLERTAGTGLPVSSWFDRGERFQAYMTSPAGSTRPDRVTVVMSDSVTGAAPGVVCVFVMDRRLVDPLLAGYERGDDGKPRYIWLIDPRNGGILCPDASIGLVDTVGIPGSGERAMKDLEKRGMNVSSAVSTMTGWYFISAVPVSRYTGALGRIRGVYAVFLCVCLGAGAIISVLFSLRNYLPVKNLARAVEASMRGGKAGGRDEFEYLADSFALLLEKQRDYEKEQCLADMLGGAYDARDFAAAIKRHGLVFSTDEFFVAGVRIDEYGGEKGAAAEDPGETLRSTIGLVFENLFRRYCDCYACRRDGRVYVIACVRPGSAFFPAVRDACREGTALVRERFSAAISVYLTAPATDGESGHQNIQRAYEEAVWGLSRMKGQGLVATRRDLFSGTSAEDPTRDLHRRIVGYIEKQYRDPNLYVASIAAHFSLSASYLHRVFKKHENSGILDYIHRRRIEEAKRLLRGSDRRVREIAGRVGYANELTFIRAFKRVEKKTPAGYRAMIGVETGGRASALHRADHDAGDEILLDEGVDDEHRDRGDHDG